MLSRAILHFRQSLITLEYNIYTLFGRFPPDLCSITVEPAPDHTRSKSLSLGDQLKDSILWAVPTHRRTVEKRLNRKFGWPNQVWKPIVAKKNLLMCQNCGDHHEAGYLCRTCYDNVKKESEMIQKELETELGLNPVDKEVVVLYQGEKDGVPEEYFKGKRIIEMKKDRPQWYSKNLLQKTTKAPATTTSVKPTDLA